MLNLLKKDLRACFKIDLKTIVKIVFGIFLFTFILAYFASIAIPLSISYVFIFKSFYLDELNKCDYFFNSMPIDKDDIVYSKYIFALIIICLSLIFTYFYSNVFESMFNAQIISLESLLMALSILLILVSLSFPVLFKYGYNKGYIFVNLLTGVVCTIGMISYFNPIVIGSMQLVDGDNSALAINNTIVNNIEFYMFAGISLLIFIISMHLSIKIYRKKEIAS